MAETKEIRAVRQVGGGNHRVLPQGRRCRTCVGRAGAAVQPQNGAVAPLICGGARLIRNVDMAVGQLG